MLDVVKGKYKIVREIARSNDIVYEAMDTSLGRRIALKELNVPPNLTGQGRRERIERFNREARAAGRLSHPNIVAVYDTGEENGSYFIAMEYLEGQTLRDMMAARGSLSLREAVDIACQMLDALGYAHANKVIHRDIKPDNIFILSGGQTKLTDFGIARLTEEPALTSNGQVFGTPSYMSPEQIVGQGIDFRSDLFSVGVLLYEMLSGRKPFTGDSVVSITYAVMNAEPPPLNGVPMAIEQVIRRAMGKRPDQRFSTAEEMRRELRNAEQMPPAFMAGAMPPQTTGMGTYYPPQLPTGMPPQNGTGYGATAYPPAGYNGSSGMGGYGTPPPSGTYYPPQSAPPPADANGLPWQFNGPNGQPAPPAKGNTGSSTPFAAPPFPARPAEPLIVLSPAVRSLLSLIAIAVLLGGGIAFGVSAFLKSYDRYRVSAGSQQLTSLLEQAQTAYNKGDYVNAAKLFEQALKANPSAAQRHDILTNLAYTYIQLAQTAHNQNHNSEARDLYLKALSYAPDNPQAHRELAGVLSLLGDSGGAQREQAAIQTGDSTPDAPANVQINTNPAPEPVNDNFVEDRRAQAQQDIQRGMEQFRAGDTKAARELWQKAVEDAPGTPESQQAGELLNENTAPPPNPE